MGCRIATQHSMTVAREVYTCKAISPFEVSFTANVRPFTSSFNTVLINEFHGRDPQPWYLIVHGKCTIHGKKIGF
jgi:hypothetical protein